MKVKDGEELGKLLRYRSIKLWQGLKWYHIHLMGGNLKTTGRFECAPYVCFKGPGTEETDDGNWMRPVWKE